MLVIHKLKLFCKNIENLADKEILEILDFKAKR